MPEENILLVKGSIPGFKGTNVVIKHTKKKYVPKEILNQEQQIIEPQTKTKTKTKGTEETKPETKETKPETKETKPETKETKPETKPET